MIVFVRAPVLGRGKRRLAATIGDIAAWRFQRACLGTVLARLEKDARWTTILAVTPDRAERGVGAPRAAGRSRRVIGQGSGDLGARMVRALRAAPPGPAVLVGADIPELRADHVWRAFRALGRADAVFGPARDGGYWLIGLARARRHLSLAGVRWSSAHALADSRAALGPRKGIALIEVLSDIDDGADYALWRARDATGRASKGV
ncbi:MAG: TIGR04282 family arsenosugar biosynthesis glycosyltransferase [Alphaproteobacteria bacterium]